MSVYLIRHGQTAGNLEGRYIGSRTDEPLCEQGREALSQLTPPKAAKVVCSPLRRCLETAAILYPELVPTVVEDLRECDFGAFEGHNYAELNGRADYQAWIDSNGELPFPGGESRKAFAARCCAAFSQIMAGAGEQDVAFVVHGGTIMAIMERFALPPQDYFAYQVRNGTGFVLHPDGTWTVL